MKIFFLMGIVIFVGLASVFAQAKTNTAKSAIIFYEENNSYISPWINLISSELTANNISVEKATAKEAIDKDFTKHTYIIIYGAVMAYMQNEPIRDWLENKVGFKGRKVNLLVTAGTGDMDKYENQLRNILKTNKAIVVDSVTSATKRLSDEEKKKLIKDLIKKLE